MVACQTILGFISEAEASSRHQGSFMEYERNKARSGKSYAPICRSYSSQCSPDYFRQRLQRYRQMRIPRLRKLASILQRGDYDRGGYVPTPTKTITNEDKDLLISRMVYGKDGPPNAAKMPLLKPRDPRHQAIMEANTTEELDLILVDDLLEEIQERQDFLSELRQYGVDHQYSSMIQTEITQKIKEAENLLHKNR
eukprot:TCALIF_06216-PA protein Name:"Similar to C22orf23 UPF0193 protein EVG1 (Homo sapiens)" AED:0.12 eAED:0.12 QI:0/0.66/0.25/0.75/0.66/0.75/4/0/195